MPTARDESRKRAATRLKHDLGKYVRFSAPETRETEAGALRERLGRDLRETRKTAEATLDAPAVFAVWLEDDGGLFTSAELDAITRPLSRVAELLPRLEALDLAGLVALDEAAAEVATACFAFHRLVSADVAA